MSHPERVVGTLSHIGEAADAVLAPQASELFPSRSQDFVRIGLMPDIENDFVPGRGVHVVQGDNDFHRTQARSQVPRIGRTYLYYIVANLRTELFEFCAVKGFEVPGGADPVEQRSVHRL